MVRICLSWKYVTVIRPYNLGCWYRQLVDLISDRIWLTSLHRIIIINAIYKAVELGKTLNNLWKFDGT